MKNGKLKESHFLIIILKGQKRQLLHTLNTVLNSWIGCVTYYIDICVLIEKERRVVRYSRI